MKKELFAVALLALILALSIMNTEKINSICGNIGSIIESSAGAAQDGDWEKSGRLLDEAMELWKKHEGYTGVVLRHTDIETLTDDFYEFTEHIYSRDAAATRAAAALVREHLDSIKNMESLNWGSIF